MGVADFLDDFEDRKALEELKLMKAEVKATPKKALLEEDIFRMNHILNELSQMRIKFINLKTSDIVKQKLEELQFWLNKDLSAIEDRYHNSPSANLADD